MFKSLGLLAVWGRRACPNQTAKIPSTQCVFGPSYSSAPSAPPSMKKSQKQKDDISYKIGFIGAGNMAKAIGFSLLDAGMLSPERLMASAHLPEFFHPWKNRGVNTTLNNDDVVSFGDIIFVAAPPQEFDEVIHSLQKPSLIVKNKKCIVSMMVGKTRESLAEAFKSVNGLKVPPQIIRVTPNMPLTVGAGCTIMACGDDEESDYTKTVQKIFSVSGSCEIIPERLMNACSATSGSSPAWVYLVIEGLADGAVRSGVSRAVAIRLASQAVIGAGQMVLKTGKHPGQLKDEICSEGGSTIAGIHALEDGGVRAAFINAVYNATKRAEELGGHKQSFMCRHQ